MVLLGFYLSWRATRLDRLHHRVETARAALDAALVRRAAAVLDLAAADGLDPEVARILADGANSARRAGETDRELAESALSATLRSALDGLPPDASSSPLLAPHLEEVAVAARGVHLARVFHNDAVADTRRARRSRLVRHLRLAGTAALPGYFEMDDRTPER
ncbi:membrane protein [Nocardiopsis oceani]